MADYSTSPNMNLPIPTVSVAPGPEWATLLDNCLTLVDQHDHSSGQGVQITPNGLNINTDLPLNGNNLISARSLRMLSNSTLLSLPTDLLTLYSSGVDLYYNDGNGNQIRLTQSGNIVGTAGSIANLVSPASASYNNISKTIVFQSDVNTAANIDVGSVIIRKVTASSPAITLSAPAGLSASYTLLLPATLPASIGVFSTDPSGNMGFWTLGSTLTSSGNILRVQTASITNAEIAPNTIINGNIADRTIQNTKLIDHTLTTDQIAAETILGGMGGNIVAATITAYNIATNTIIQSNIAPRVQSGGPTGTSGQIVVNGQSGTFSTTSTTFVDVPNCSVTLTTNGRPVMLMVRPILGVGSSSANGNFSVTNVTNISPFSQIIIGWLSTLGGIVQSVELGHTNSAFGAFLQAPPAIANFLDTSVAGAPGTYTWTLQVKVIGVSTQAGVNNVEILAYEI